MKNLPKILAVMLLSTCCLFGAAACEKTSSAPEPEHLQQQRTAEYDEATDGEAPQSPDRADSPDCPVQPRGKRHKHGEEQGEEREQSDAKEGETEENGKNGAKSDAENGGDRKTHKIPGWSENGDFRSRKRLPISPAPRPLPAPRPEL